MTQDAGIRNAPAAGRAVDIDAVIHELSRLWNEPDAPDAAAGMRTRACMSNLVVVCDREREADLIAAEVAEIVQPHPSRVILLVTGAESPAEDIDAFVSAQCYLGSGGRQICSEQVVVRARPNAVRRLPSIVRSLIIGDLPTTVWWAAESTPELTDLAGALAPLADQIVYDSAKWGATLAALQPSLSRVMALPADVAVADLAWHRLLPWLHFMCEALDPHVLPGGLESVTAVVIEHGPAGLSQATLLAGWLASRLDWRVEGSGGTPPEHTWTFRSARGQPRVTIRPGSAAEPPSLCTVTIRTVISGAPVQLAFAPVSAGRLEVTAEGVTLPVRFRGSPVVERGEIIALQLSDLGRNRLFTEALTMAARLIGK